MSATLPTLSPDELSRYSRHILLDEVGLAGQRRLAAAKVLVVGAGGLGSPAALYLAAAGIGTLGIADLDTVEAHNLQRQLLHSTANIGESKVHSAADRLKALNPHICIVTHTDGIQADNAVEIFRQYDVIVDGTDNFTARYLNNQAAFASGRPLVFGSVFKFEGQVTLFDPAGGGPCYCCLFPEPPAAGSVPGCGEAGVLGAVCGVIGSLQALEAIKHLLNIGQTLRGRLLTYDSLTQTFRTLAFARAPGCPVCSGQKNHGRKPIDSAAAAAVPFRAVEDFPLEISVHEARDLLERNQTGVQIIDVREPWETEICRIKSASFVPMRQIPQSLASLSKDEHLLVLCHHGSRSQQVAKFLRAQGFPKVSNITGGIDAWAAGIDPSMRKY